MLGDRTYAMAGGNLNGDALRDVMLNTDGALHTFVAQGSAIFSETWTNSEAGIGFAQVLADFNHDGYDDFFAGSFWTGQMRVYLNRPSSHTFQLAWSGQLSSKPLYDANVGDLNGDGHLDLIVGGESEVSVYRSVFLTQHFYLPVLLRN